MKTFPYTFVSNKSFPLKPHMMRSYPRRGELNLWETILNYRLSRARRVIENTFGILVRKFRIFHRQIIAHVDNAKFITKADVALHNFPMKTQTNSSGFDYCPPDFVDQENGSVKIPGQWSSKLLICKEWRSNNFAGIAKEVRDNFKEYFNSVQIFVPRQGGK